MSAATALEAWALPDTLIADLYSSEAGFRAWCNSTLFPAELASLINSLLNQSERTPFGLLDVLGKVMPAARALEGTDDALQSLDESQQAFVASGNSNAGLNTELEAEDVLPSNEGTFALRLLSLPRAVVDQIRAGQNATETNQSMRRPGQSRRRGQSRRGGGGMAQLPGRSSLNLAGKDPRSSLTLITGTGALQESLACFRMLAEVMGLPFRRDALEKPSAMLCAEANSPTSPCSASWLLAWACMPQAPRCQRVCARV